MSLTRTRLAVATYRRSSEKSAIAARTITRPSASFESSSENVCHPVCAGSVLGVSEPPCGPAQLEETSTFPLSDAPPLPSTLKPAGKGTAAASASTATNMETTGNTRVATQAGLF